LLKCESLVANWELVEVMLVERGALNKIVRLEVEEDVCPELLRYLPSNYLTYCTKKAPFTDVELMLY
jgi:hypothetical protein